MDAEEIDVDPDWNPLVVVIGALGVLAITWYLFWEIIHPTLVSISPLFASNSSGRVGRTPDSLAQVALFATILLGLFVYYNLLILVFDGIEEFVRAIQAVYILVIILPVAIIKNYVVEKFISTEQDDP